MDFYQVKHIKLAVQALKFQIAVDQRHLSEDVNSIISNDEDFNGAENAPEVKELLGGSLSDYLNQNSYILNALNLTVLHGSGEVLNPWLGRRHELIDVVMSCGHDADNLETHQSLLEKLQKLI